jgi:protein-disulfide isomerase
MPNEQGMSKRQLLREKRRRDAQRNRLLSVGAIVLGALVVFALMILPGLMPVDITKITPFERPNADFNAAGDPDAPIKITEYSDYQCPYCARFVEQTEEQLVQTYVASGQVYFIFRSLGLFIGPESQAAAEAAYCAGDENKYWQYHDMLFANNTGENVGDYTTRKLQAFAEALELDMTAFNSCLDSGKYAERVTQDGVDGMEAGINATPSFLMTYTVNGETKSKVIQGAQAFDAFQAEIEAALAEMAAAQ